MNPFFVYMRVTMKSLVSVIGLGYVGLSTAVCLASRGIKTIGVEKDPNKLKAISSGHVPFHEERLPQMLNSTMKKGTFECTNQIHKAVEATRFSFITVGTPSKPSGEIDTGYVESACVELGEALKRKKVWHAVVVKSTVVSGTTEELIKHTLEASSSLKAGEDFGLAVNPEFLREGTAVYDTFHPDALVLGCSDRRTLREIKKLFQKFYRKLPSVIETSTTNAEFIKYSVNTFRAVQLSYLNTLANLSNVLPDSDVGDVVKGLATIMKLDNRYLRPGPGFGGSCLPKDTRALAAHMRKKGVDASVLESALSVNLKQSKVIVDMAEGLTNGLSGKRVAILGLSFKGNTDDVRESPSLNIISELLSRGAVVAAYDPKAMENTRRILGDKVLFSDRAKDCIKGTHCCIIATDWKEFQTLGPNDFRTSMKTPVVVDARRIFEPESFRNSGVLYRRLGTSR
jgi:UDPglucose 6-dehydrogenase